jgi:hypothetical protein
VDNTIRPTSTWMALGNGSTGSVTVQGGRAELRGRSALLKLTSGSTARVDLDRTVITSTTTALPINVEGGRVKVTRTGIPPRSRALRPGVLES